MLEKYPKTRPIARRLLKLEDKRRGAAFPKMARARQITPSYCGPAVLASLFSFLGIKVSQTAVVKSVNAQEKIKKFGLAPDVMAKAVKKLGRGKFVFWLKTGSTVSDLSKVVNKYKFPVGVEWQGVFYEDEDEDNGHYSIVTRVNKEAGFLRLSDPYYKFSGIDRKFKLDEFKKRWWDTNMIGKKEIVDRKTMFVITPKGTSWPRDLGMKKVI